MKKARRIRLFLYATAVLSSVTGSVHAAAPTCMICGPDTQSTSTTSMAPTGSDINTEDMAPTGHDINTEDMSGPKETTVTISPAACKQLTQATPDASVAYQPGVDVNGKPVVPADVPGSPTMKIPDKIQIPLTLNLAKTLNLNTSSYPYNQLGEGTEATLGTLTVEGNRVSFNGQPLSDDQQDKLAILCLHPK